MQTVARQTGGNGSETEGAGSDSSRTVGKSVGNPIDFLIPDPHTADRQKMERVLAMRTKVVTAAITVGALVAAGALVFSMASSSPAPHKSNVVGLDVVTGSTIPQTPDSTVAPTPTTVWVPPTTVAPPVSAPHASVKRPAPTEQTAPAQNPQPLPVQPNPQPNTTPSTVWTPPPTDVPPGGMPHK